MIEQQLQSSHYGPWRISSLQSLSLEYTKQVMTMFHNIRHFIFSLLAFEKLYKEIITALVTLSKYAKNPKVHQGVQ
jgi:hypothetical protein